MGLWRWTCMHPSHCNPTRRVKVLAWGVPMQRQRFLATVLQASPTESATLPQRARAQPASMSARCTMSHAPMSTQKTNHDSSRQRHRILPDQPDPEPLLSACLTGAPCAFYLLVYNKAQQSADSKLTSPNELP